MLLLQLFGYIANNERDYLLTDAKSALEVAKRTETAQEFRRFYDELKKRKEDDVGIMEYYLSVSFFLKKGNHALLIGNDGFILAFE